jgi:hypothetical protein
MGVTITGKNGITSRQRPGGIYRIAGVAAGEQHASGLSQMFHH